MFTLTYHKFGGKWFLDCPEYLESGGAEDDLECIGHTSRLLDLVSNDDLNARLLFSFEPFDGCDEAMLAGSSGGRSGGYYFLHRFGDREVDLELWVNQMIYQCCEELPRSFYLKKA
ncbi:MAG TPA: DUF6717 family protein [Chitinophagaceae bacterium]